MEQVLDNLDKGSYDTETLGLHNPHIDGPKTSSQAGTATENNSRLYENTEDETLHSSTAGIMDTCGGEILVEAPSKVDISLKNTCKGPDSTSHGENSIKEENGISKSDTEKDLSDEFEEVKELNKKDLSLNLEHMDLNSSLAKHISGDISPKDKITYAHTPFEEMNDTLDDVVRQPAQFLPSWQSPHTAEECYKMEKEIVIREGTAKRNADSLLGKIAAPEEIKVSKCKNDEKMESKENTEAEVTEEKKINTDFPQSKHEVQSILEHIGEKLAEATTMQFEDKYLETTNAVKDIEEKLVTEEKIVQENEAISDKYENTSTTALDQIQSITIVQAEARDGVLEGEVQSRDGKDESDLMAEEQVAELSTVRHKVDIEIPNNEPNSALAIKISAEDNTQEETTRPRNKLVDEVLKESETQRKFDSSAAQLTEVVYPLDGEKEGEQNGKITEVMHDVGQCCEREPGLHDKEQSCEVVVPEQDEMITLVTMRYMPNFSEDKVDDSSKNYEKIHGPGIGKLENASEDGHVLSTTDTEAYNYGSGNDYVDSLSVVENAKSKNPPTLPEAKTEKYINKRITEEEPELQKDESENSKFESNSTAASTDLQVTGENANPEIENKDKEELVMYIEGSSQEDKDYGTHKVTTDMMHEYQQIMEIIDLNEGPQTAIRKQADNHEKDIGYMSDSQQLAEEKIHENVCEKQNQAPDSTYDRQIHQTSGSEEPAGLKEETETKMSEVDSAQSEEWIKGMIGETKTTKIENTPGDNMFSSLTMLQASNEVHKPEGYVHSVALNEERKIKDKAILEEDKIRDRDILEPSLKKIDEIPEETANNRRSVSRLEKDLVENSCELESQEEPESISMRKNTDIGAPNETKSSDGIVEKSFSNTSKSLTKSADVVNKRQILGEEGPTEDADSTRVKCEVVEVMIQEKDNRNVEQVALENDYRSQSKESNEFNDNVKNGITSEEVKEPDLTIIAQNFELVAEAPRIKIKLPDDDEKPVMKFDAADAQSYDTSTQQKENYNIAAEESEAATSKYEETIIKSDDHSPDSPTVWSQELIHEVTNNEGDIEVDVHLKEIASVSNINSVSEPEYQNQNVTVESEAAKVDNPTSNDEPSYKIPDADLSDDTKTVKVKDEQKESIDEICDNQVSIVQITPATSLEKNEEASTCMYEEQIHRVTNRGDNEEAEAWEEKTNSEKLKIITDLVPEDQSPMTTSEFEAIKTHDLTYDNLENKQIEEILDQNDDQETALRNHEDNREKRIEDTYNNQWSTEETIHIGVSKKHKGAPNSPHEEKIYQNSKSNDNIETAFHKEDSEPNMLELTSVAPENQSMGMTVEEKTTMIENTFGDVLTTLQAPNVAHKEGHVPRVSLNKARNIIENRGLEEEKTFNREISELDLKKIYERSEETNFDGTSASSPEHNMVAKSCELESEAEPESISMHKNNDETVRKEEQSLDRILENCSSTMSEALEQSSDVGSERQLSGVGGVTKDANPQSTKFDTDEVTFQEKDDQNIKEVAFENAYGDQSNETTEAENRTTYEEVENSDLTIIAQNFEIVAEIQSIETKLESDEESPTVKFDAKDQSHNASSIHKENTSTIHLSEENENVDNKNEEPRDKKRDYSEVTSGLDEAESMSLNGVQKESTIKADDMEDKILNQKNYNVVADNKENEAANLKDGENIKQSDCSPIVPAIGEETRQELTKENEKITHGSFGGQIHEGIRENDSINFDIQKEENKSEKIESSSAVVMNEEKCKKTSGVEVFENRSKVGTSTVSLEAFEEKTNLTASSSDDDKPSHEVRDTSKSKGDMSIVESKGTGGEAEKLGMQRQAMEGEEMNEVYALASEVTYKSFEKEMNQEGRELMKEGTLDASHGIDSGMATKTAAIVDESLEEQNLDEDEAFKGIEKEVKDTNLISQRFETPAEKRHVTSDDERNCNPMNDVLTERETSVENITQKHPSIVVSEGLINDVMEDSEIGGRNILEKADNKKGDTDTSFEIDSPENEKRDEGNEIQPEKKLSDAKGINERKKNESTEENKIAERSSKNEKYEDVGELENPANVLPEGSQRENENIKRDSLEKEGINATLEEYPHKDGHKILEIETTNSEPLNQCNQQVLSCDNTEHIIHHDKIVESENASEGVRNVDEIHEDNADSNESVEEIMKTQSIGSPLQMEKMEFQTFEAFEEQLESIKSENEEKPDKNETLGVNSQKDVKEVQLKRLSNDELDRVETAESIEQIEDIIAEKNINDAPDPRVGEDATHEHMHKDEIEAEKNDEPEAIKKSAAIDITSEPPNDEVTEFNGEPFEHNTLIMGLTEETETKSSLNEENEKEMPGISVITSAEETMQEAGHKLVEVSDIIPSEGDEIPEVAINVLLVTDCSKTNTINPEGGGDIGEASKLVPEEEVDKRNIPLTEVKENEEKPNKFSVKQKIETCPVTKERERMSQTQEASLEVAELDELLNEGMNLNELPLSRSLMSHNLRLEHEMLDKTGGVDSEDKPKENESKHCNDVVVSNQETMFSLSPEQVTEDNIEAEKKLENTSDLMLEKQGNGVKKNTKDLEDDNSLEAMIAKHEGISISSPAEQMKEEESILEDKKERSIIQNYNIAAEESEAATSKYEETIIKSVDHSPDTPSLLSQELIHEAEGDTEVGLHLKEIVSENNIISVSEPEYQSQDLRVESEDAKVDNPTCNEERSCKIPNADLSDDTKTVKVKEGEYLKESIDDIRDNQILMMQITPYTALEKYEEASPSMYEEKIHKVINRGDNEEADAWEEKTNSEKLQIMTDLVLESKIQKTTSEFEATKIHDSTCDDLENKNYNAVGGDKEKEVANLKDEENIKHSVCSPILHAIGEETRQESPKEHQKTPHASFKGQIHEGISENDSINFNILKEENKIEKIESSYAIVIDEEKWNKTNVVEVIENDSEVGTSTVSLETFEEKTNITTSSSDDDEVSLEARETSKSKGDKNLVESKGTDGEEAKLGIQDQSMEGEKMNEAYALASEVTYKSFENEMNQEERAPTNEGTLDACHGIDSDIASKNPAMVDEVDCLQGRNLDEDEAFKGIDKEVKDTNLISRIFETTVEKRHVTSDDERNCNPMEDDLSEQETSVEKNIEKHASMVVSEGHIHDIMEDGEIAERNILEKANNEKRNADLSLEILSLENENQGKEMEINQEKKLSDINSINERNKIKSTEENEFLERCLKNEKYEDVEEFENPAKVLPEGLQTESANINRERQEKEGVNDSLEEWPHKDGHKILEIAITNLEPLNQSTQQVLSCDNTECVIHHDEIVESENASEEVGNVNVIYEDNADSDESVEEITKSQSIGSPLQMEKMELETVGAFEEQLESIKKEDEEKPHKNETSGVNSQKDVKDVQLKSLSNDELDRVETAESSEQIEDIIAENDINDPCVVEDATHEPLHKDEIEAKKNDEPKAIQKSGTINTTSEPSNDEVTELNCVPFKHNTSIMALTEEIEAMSSLNDKNVKEMAGISVIRSAEETMQEAGQKLVEVSDNMPGDGEEIPEENINVLRVIGSSKTNTIKEEGGGDIGEVSQLVSEEVVNKRGIPLAEVKEDEERSNKFSVKQNIEMGPPTEERERMSQTQEASPEVAELDELPVSRLLMEHILRFEREAPDKTCDVDSEDKAKENDSQECNDVVASIQGTVFSSSLEEVKDTIEADKKLENTSDLMLENQSDDVKENTENLEDVNSLERNLCGSSSSLAVAEAMITQHEGISIPLLAEQMKEEENISEDKKESSMKVENACESAHNIEAKGSIQNVVVQDDKTPRTTLCEPHPTLTVGDGAKEMISEQQSCPDSKVDTEHFREPALVQDDKIHPTALENKMTKHAIQKENESANKSVDISPDTEASQKDVSQEEGEKDGNEALHAAVSSDSEASREDISQKEGEKGGIEILHAVEMTHPFIESVGKTGSLILNEQDGQTGIAFEPFNIEDQKNQEPPETGSQVVKVENAQENQDGKNESQVQNLQNYSAEVLNVSKSHKVQQSDLLEEPTNGTVQVSESFLEKRNPAVTIEKQKIIEATATQAEEEKTDEEIDEKEEEDEHKTKESGHDTVVIVQDKDANSKPARKKSQNILAGVGTKVKHSFAKVKKAITGKSSHSKTASPK